MTIWKTISAGEKAPEIVNVIIEIPKGSNNKYEMDKRTGLIALDRANYNATAYPFDYGFVPQTLWEDGDPLDVAVLTTFPLFPGILVRVRPVAIMEMNDGGESDAKIIAVPVSDVRWNDVQDLEDLNSHSLKEYKHFFETYKQLKEGEGNHHVSIDSIKGKKEALAAIEHAMELYEMKVSS